MRKIKRVSGAVSVVVGAADQIVPVPPFAPNTLPSV